MKQYKRDTALTGILLIMILSSFALYHTEQDGKRLYERNCAPCHGDNGTKAAFGAKNLQVSILNDSALLVQIRNGKRIMPAFRKRFSQQEITAVMQYVKLLRK
ncbi:MAG: cytochrome c [Chitinophagaceae bacterium]